jgi:4-amino-4-deoxy-L-arabinose transferase-like glycosyltransferase
VIRRLLLIIPAVLVLAFCYHAGASLHSRAMNTQRVRADQSGYLWDAVAIYQGRHGGPDTLIGERNRMPVYPWLLSWLYDPAMSPDEFFEVAKRWNIWLSMVLLAVLAAIAFRQLPPLIALNFVLVVAFGCYIFKAGYAQVELLFYLLFFLTFLACWRLVRAETPPATLMYGALAGVLTALSHLSKASMLPFVGITLLVLALRAVSPLLARRPSAAIPARRRDVFVRAAGIAVFVVCFLAVLWPYISNSKKYFGHYFYNVNSTFYVWYDDWPAASMGTYQDGDGKGWPTTPPDEIPSMRKYLREHTVGQIADRVVNGFREMVTVSYTRLWYFKFTAMYVVFALALAARGWRQFLALVRRQPDVFLFMVLYGLGYAAAVAFYQPISGTSLRMLLAHLAPLLFVVSALSAHPSFRDLQWSVAGATVRPIHFHLLMVVTILFDMAFVLPWRLTADFAGY